MDKRTAKKVSSPVLNIVAACQAWAALEDAIGAFSAAHTGQNAARMMELLDEVLELQASSPALPGIDRLVEYLTGWVEVYEAVQQPMPHVDPIDLLKHLMEANGLKQSDLAAELGGQPVVSAVLRRKRKINIRQAFALGKRFGLAAAAFIEDAEANAGDVEADSLVTEGEARMTASTPASTGTRGGYEQQLTSGGLDLPAASTHWLDLDSSQQIILDSKWLPK